MHIGIVSEYYRPWPGGISEHVHHEASELRRRGHKVVILTGPAIGGRPAGESGVIRVGFGVRVPRNRSSSRITLGRYLLTMRYILRRLHLDVLHIHAPLEPVLGMVALAASETVNVGTFHANFDPTIGTEILYHTLHTVPQRLFDRLHWRIAVSESARRSFAHYFPADYDIIPNGVDTNRFHPDVEPLPEFSDGRPNILFVGRFDPRKGLPLLLAAFPDVRRRVPGVRLIVVGEMGRQKKDDLMESLPDEARPDVTFAGYVTPELLPRYHASCHVFCSPATGQESFGIVLLEAMAAARPPVAFDIPGYRDVITHGTDGWLVPHVEASALADGLTHVLQDGDLRAAMGEAGRRTALRYSWAAVAEKLEDRFTQAQNSARLHPKDGLLRRWHDRRAGQTFQPEQ